MDATGTARLSIAFFLLCLTASGISRGAATEDLQDRLRALTSKDWRVAARPVTPSETCAGSDSSTREPS